MRYARLGLYLHETATCPSASAKHIETVSPAHSYPSFPPSCGRDQTSTAPAQPTAFTSPPLSLVIALFAKATSSQSCQTTLATSIGRCSTSKRLIGQHTLKDQQTTSLGRSGTMTLSLNSLTKGR